MLTFRHVTGQIVTGQINFVAAPTISSTPTPPIKPSGGIGHIAANSLLICTYFLSIYQHRDRLRLPVPNLIRHRALTRDFKLRDHPKRRGHGLDYQFTNAIVTVSFIMSHVTITISSTTIIEFPIKNIDSYNNDPIGT